MIRVMKKGQLKFLELKSAVFEMKLHWMGLIPDKTLQKKKSIDLNALQQNLPKTKH